MLIEWALKHISTIAFLFLFAIAAGSSAVAKHEMSRAQELHEQLKTAATTIDRMAQDQQTIGRISHDYETRLASINRQLAAARLRPSLCVVPSSPTAGGYNASPGAGQPVGPHGISSDWLREYAAEAARYQEQLKACQNYVRAVVKPY